VGIAKAVFVGTTLNVAGASTLAAITGTFNGTVGATTPSTGAFTTLSATGITTVAAGSAALPAIVSTTGTADTGLWFPAADTIAASTAGTERLRIDSSGNLLVGTTTTNPAATGIVGTELLNAGGLRVSATASASYFALTAASGTQITFYTYSAGAIAAGTIACPTTTTTTYNSVSDHRLKSNVVPLTNSGAIIDALKPRSFTWNVDGSPSVGFIADEVQAVIPNAVTGAKDAVDEDGKPVYQMLDASTPEMMAYLIAEIQSLRKRITALEAK
jgi:hypothetical protein